MSNPTLGEKVSLCLKWGMSIGGVMTVNGPSYYICFTKTGSLNVGFASMDEALNHAYQIATRNESLTEAITEMYRNDRIIKDFSFIEKIPNNKLCYL